MKSDGPATLTPPSLHTFLSEIFDYAGQYPPARLSLEEALHNYARYRNEPEAWMLARFVHPARRLRDLAPHASLFSLAPPFRFSVLGTGGTDVEAFLTALDEDLKAIQAFHDHHPAYVLADVMEVHLPEPLLHATPGEAEHFFDEVARQVDLSGLSELAFFFEIPLDDAPDHWPPLLAVIAEHNSRRRAPLRSEVGLKMRCGGMSPIYAPTPEALAFGIAACQRAGVRFKVTAGLHHPVRHYDEATGETMHGFFNVFGAAALADSDTSELDADVLRLVLEDTDPDHFRFTTETFAWNELHASIEDIHRARKTLAFSAGSCSFDEPRDDLRAMGLL